MSIKKNVNLGRRELKKVFCCIKLNLQQLVLWKELEEQAISASFSISSSCGIQCHFTPSTLVYFYISLVTVV